MFKVELTANFDKLDLITKEKLKEDVRKELIRDGLNDTLQNSLKFLKAEVEQALNSEVRFKTVIENSEDIQDSLAVNIPKTHKDVIKELFGVDLDKVNPNVDFTRYGQSNVVLLNSNRAILKMDESIFSDSSQSYEKAVKFFQEAIFIDLSGQTPRYFYADPKLNIQQWVKAFCSRDVGITPRTQKRFTGFQSKGESEWRLKQEGVKQINKNSVDISGVIDLILKGDYETASNALKSKPYSRLNHYVDQKIQQFQKGQTVTTDFAIYNSILAFVRNMHFEKIVTDKMVTYRLVSNYTEADGTNGAYKHFFDELDSKLSIWFLINEKEWFFDLVDKAEKLIRRYQKG